MDRFLICNNPQCHLIVDRRIDGRSLERLEQVLTQCPSCGGSWSSTCPSCGQTLAVKTVAGEVRRVCCSVKPHTAEEIAEQPHAMTAQFGA